jgi:hypothetical protein
MKPFPSLARKKYPQLPGSPLHLSEMIGRGHDRECWRHPDNLSLCIKVATPEQERAQNDIDFHYGRHLARRAITGPHLTRVHGWVNTDRGQGLAFELVQQPDGTPAPPLKLALRQGFITAEEAAELVREAFNWLTTHNVILADCGLDNFLVQQLPDGRRRLVFVDGLGARNFGVKYWARRTFGFLARRKARQFRQRTLHLLTSFSPVCRNAEETGNLGL